MQIKFLRTSQLLKEDMALLGKRSAAPILALTLVWAWGNTILNALNTDDEITGDKFLYCASTRSYLYVSPKKSSVFIDPENIVAADATKYAESLFNITSAGVKTLPSGDVEVYKIYNAKTNRFLFVSQDDTRDLFNATDIERVVEAHGAPDEERNKFAFQRVAPGVYKIYHPDTNRYVFVSNDVWGGYNIVEAHGAPDEERNHFHLIPGP